MLDPAGRDYVDQNLKNIGSARIYIPDGAGGSIGAEPDGSWVFKCLNRVRVSGQVKAYLPTNPKAIITAEALFSNTFSCPIVGSYLMQGLQSSSGECLAIYWSISSLTPFYRLGLWVIWQTVKPYKGSELKKCREWMLFTGGQQWYSRWQKAMSPFQASAVSLSDILCMTWSRYSKLYLLK